MTNPTTLGILLRTLQRDPAILSPPPAPPVTPAVAVKAVEGGEARPGTQTAANPDSHAPPQGPPPDARAPAGPLTSRTASAAGLAAAKANAPTGSPLLPVGTPEAEPATIVKLGTATAPAAAGNAPGAPPAAEIQLSRAAQLLGELLKPGAAAGPIAPVSASPRETPAPLLARAPASPPGAPGAPSFPAHDLAQALAGAVTHSGIFYEAHLAEWAASRLPLADLVREPQAAWVRAEAATTGGASVLSATASPEATDRVATTETRAETLPPLVRQQIETLETRQFGWQGELWPGQHAAIAFAEDRREGRPRSPREATTVWRTHLELQLPELGTVAVDLMLDGSALVVDIVSAGPAAAARLHAAAADLRATLAARTLDVQGFAIRHEHAR